ncbi:pro-resilin-like [Eriocheir sinensis]|uniref:pro-resilin-like n=1 Tax=Eriocheir sinensis TaxID=95602 RepID=UPI0021C8CB31|nr:pro-resilin-like [Eriocheir sinensis]
MAAKLSLLLLGLATTLASTAATSYGTTQQNAAPANYDFNWAVNDAPSGNNYGQQESRQGDSTRGSYYVQLPDGRLQRVDYTVSGGSGFVAQVTYEGVAQFPQQSGGYGAPAQSYGTPTNRPQQGYGR